MIYISKFSIQCQELFILADERKDSLPSIRPCSFHTRSDLCIMPMPDTTRYCKQQRHIPDRLKKSFVDSNAPKEEQKDRRNDLIAKNAASTACKVFTHIYT
jgi:hypothetical protein